MSMLLEVAASAGCAAAGYLAWGVRGRSSQMFGRSIWRGPANRKALALTFDDGPSESTPELLRLLEEYGAKATFFQCGHHARRLPRVCAECAARGHEIGNHTDTHPWLYFRSPDFIYDQISRAQDAISDAAGVTPRLFRAPFGARWFGVAAAQHRLSLTGVMWTTIARDWTLDANGIATRLSSNTRPGAIFCLHDGRELQHKPDISVTLQALRELLPRWQDQGYEFCTVSRLTSMAASA